MDADETTCRWANCQSAVEQDGDVCDATHCERCGCPIDHGEPITLIAEWVRDEVTATGGPGYGYPVIIVCDVCTDDEECEMWQR